MYYRVLSVDYDLPWSRDYDVIAVVHHNLQLWPTIEI